MRFKADKKLSLGALLWISSIQYFTAQIIVISAWPVPHSLTNNFISDLGNTECGIYAGLPVCSPLWLLMNISFVVFGCTMAAGAILIMKSFKRTKLTLLAFGLMVLAGIGTVMVGLFPENTISELHIVGAVLSLAVGNVSVLLIGINARPMPTWLRIYTICSATVSLIAFLLFAFEVYAGIGRGGMERLISYPFTIWMIVFGAYYLYLGINNNRGK